MSRTTSASTGVSMARSSPSAPVSGPITVAVSPASKEPSIIPSRGALDLDALEVGLARWVWAGSRSRITVPSGARLRPACGLAACAEGVGVGGVALFR
ncbi:hypothetical protein [Thermocatellispora tengchongensis]|uniref:hypothetical protein n=1 Tax=Thermocatellispora tengchongensis TaxID=1073253 RepID=UPI0036392BCA